MTTSPRRFFKLMVGSIILATIPFFITACGQKEIHELRLENESLKTKVVSLEQEVSKLKETADYHYQQGVGFFADGNYEGAKTELKIVIEKYPLSPLVASAKQQLVKAEDEFAKREVIRRAQEEQREAERRAEEERRREEEKYRPRSPQEAIEEWKKFRNNEEACKGVVTTWRFKCRSVYRGLEGVLDPMGEGGKGECEVQVGSWGGVSTMSDLERLGELIGGVKEGDWIVVTGEFEFVSDSGTVFLSPIRVKNEGYK